jgi:hypothetical protein
VGTHVGNQRSHDGTDPGVSPTWWFPLALPCLAFIAGPITILAVHAPLIRDDLLSAQRVWIPGAAVGVMLAMAAFRWWSVAVLIANGFAGVLLGTGIARLLDIADDRLTIVFATGVLMLLLALTVLLDYPVFLMFLTMSFVSATLVADGVSLILGRYELILRDPWWWTIVAAAFIAGTATRCGGLTPVALHHERRRWILALSNVIHT